VEACTLCDMCFMTKCPYVPPHEFNIDFPHLMLRYRAVENAEGKTGFVEKQLSQTDRNGKLAAPVSGVVNWGSKCGNKLTRPILETVAGIDRNAALPKFHGLAFTARAKREPIEVNVQAPAYGRKAVLYATCFVNYNNPDIGQATRAILARNGVETEVVHPKCCGMPLLEHGDLDAVAANARDVSAALKPYIEKGYDVIALVPSCALMLKFEWPLIVPGDDDIKTLSEATFDVSEYIVDIAKREGLAAGLKPLEGGVTLHLACHARAQNMGQKAAEMLRLIPDSTVGVIERCSGHGGSWGVMKENFEVAMKVGKPVAKQAVDGAKPFVASECPLAAEHILQGMERIDPSKTPVRSWHPIEIFARAYGLGEHQESVE
jgi:glycerol-3-phosphate dehydrogenase subunit C